MSGCSWKFPAQAVTGRMLGARLGAYAAAAITPAPAS
jgi:hypothetical protein